MRALSSFRYGFNHLNQLTIAGPHDALEPSRMVEGRVGTDAKNRLIYRVNSPIKISGRRVPRVVQLDGTWALTRHHELALVLHEAARRRQHTLYVKGALVEGDANTLAFALRRHEVEERRADQRLTLSGRWAADASNRLTFLVDKGDGTADRLTLQGGWELGPHHELQYRYQERSTGARPVRRHLLSLEGSWDVTAADRLIYRLAGSQDSAFEFSAKLQTPSLIARDGRLTYQVGIRLSRDRVERRQVTLFGIWKLNRDLSVLFEIPYAKGRVGTIRFEGAHLSSSHDRVVIALSSGRRERLGLTLTFTRDVVRDTSLWLQLRNNAQERSILGGVTVRF